jgi:hypothetical protein
VGEIRGAGGVGENAVTDGQTGRLLEGHGEGKAVQGVQAELSESVTRPWAEMFGADLPDGLQNLLE